LKKLLFAFLAVGFGETVGQILLIRELIINFQGNELSLGVILANWLLMVALGSWGLGRLADRLSPKAPIFVITQILFCLILPAQLILVRTINNLIGIELGEIVGLIPIFYSSLLVVAPLCLLNGFQFALGSSILAEGSKEPAIHIGKIYISEAIGCMAGGVIFTYLLVHYFHPFEIAVYTGLLNLFTALLLLQPWRISWRLKREVMVKFLVLMVILSLGLGFYSLASDNIDGLHQLSRKWQWKGYNLIHHQDSVYGNVAITQSNGQFNFFESGLLIFSSPDPDIALIEEIAHFPLLYHPSPKKVLLVGGGIGGVLDQILKHPIDELDYVELDPLIIKVAKKYSSAPALDNPRVKIKYTDGRFFVKHTQEKYDLIVVNFPPPSTLQLNRVYTQEFFSEAHYRLNPEGIFTFGLPSSEAYMSKEMINHNRCIYQTLKEAFPNVSVIPGDYSIFLASPGIDLSTIDLETICERFQNRKLETSLFTVPYIEYKLSPERIERLLAPLLGEGHPEINQDLQPIGTYYNLALWNVMFYPSWRGFFNFISGVDLWWIAIPLGLFIISTLLWLRWGRAGRARYWPITLAIATTGLAGMTFSLVLLFTFQTLFGCLYQKIGVFIAAFMLGLAFGGLTMNNIMAKLRSEFLSFTKIESALITYSLLLPFILILFFAEIARLPAFIPEEMPLALLNCLAGFLIGLEFPLANKIYLGVLPSGRVGQVAGTLYGSDLFGAIFGAILATVFLIPILGIIKTCFLIAIIKIASLSALVISSRFKVPKLEK